MTAVEDLGPAQESGLMEGDIIAEINQKNIETPKELEAVVEAARKARRKAILLKVWRDGRSRYIGVPFRD